MNPVWAFRGRTETPGVHQLLPQAALPHTLSFPAAAMLVPTTRKCSPRLLQCVITALSPSWLQLGANTTSQSLHLPNMVHFLSSQLWLKTKNYQFWVSLLWISHLQSFWCTEGKLVPTSNLPLQSGSSLGTNTPLTTHMVFVELLPSCWFWQWPPTSWPSETTFPPLPPLFSLKTIKSGQSTYLEKSDPKNSSPNP